MFNHYKYLYYLSSLIGLSPFSYHYQNNELKFSFPHLKIVYSIFMFSCLAIYISLQLYFECYESVLNTFLMFVTVTGFLISWFCSYFLSYYNSKTLINILKRLFKMEKMKKPQKSFNIHFIWYSAINVLLLIIYIIHSIVDDMSQYSIPEQCLYPMDIQFICNTTVMATFIFTLTELRIDAIEWQIF